MKAEVSLKEESTRKHIQLAVLIGRLFCTARHRPAAYASTLSTRVLVLNLVQLNLALHSLSFSCSLFSRGPLGSCSLGLGFGYLVLITWSHVSDPLLLSFASQNWSCSSRMLWARVACK